MSKTYSFRECPVCHKDIRAAGFAWAAHCRKHVREGTMIERITRDKKGYKEYYFSKA